MPATAIALTENQSMFRFMIAFAQAKTEAGATAVYAVAPAKRRRQALSSAANACASAPLSGKEGLAVSAVPAAFPARRSKARRDGPGCTHAGRRSCPDAWPYRAVFPAVVSFN